MSVFRKVGRSVVSEPVRYFKIWILTSALHDFDRIGVAI